MAAFDVLAEKPDYDFSAEFRQDISTLRTAVLWLGSQWEPRVQPLLKSVRDPAMRSLIQEILLVENPNHFFRIGSIPDLIEILENGEDWRARSRAIQLMAQSLTASTRFTPGPRSMRALRFAETFPDEPLADAARKLLNRQSLAQQLPLSPHIDGQTWNTQSTVESTTARSTGGTALRQAAKIITTALFLAALGVSAVHVWNIQGLVAASSSIPGDWNTLNEQGGILNFLGAGMMGLRLSSPDDDQPDLRNRVKNHKGWFGSVIHRETLSDGTRQITVRWDNQTEGTYLSTDPESDNIRSVTSLNGSTGPSVFHWGVFILAGLLALLTMGSIDSFTEGGLTAGLLWVGVAARGIRQGTRSLLPRSGPPQLRIETAA